MSDQSEQCGFMTICPLAAVKGASRHAEDRQREGRGQAEGMQRAGKGQVKGRQIAGTGQEQAQ